MDQVGIGGIYSDRDARIGSIRLARVAGIETGMRDGLRVGDDSPLLPPSGALKLTKAGWTPRGGDGLRVGTPSEVDGRPVPKIIDFGTGKAIAQQPITVDVATMHTRLEGERKVAGGVSTSQTDVLPARFEIAQLAPNCPV
jgi:hypothetical protein